MSSVSAGLNSFATVGIIDLYRRLFGGSSRSEAQNFRVAKYCTLICGLLATLAAIWISRFQTTIVQTLVKEASRFIGPISGIFLLGALTRRANLVGVLVGGLAGLTAAFLVDQPFISNRLNWLWTAPLGSVVTFVVGYLSSLPFQSSRVRPSVARDQLFVEAAGAQE
jgi:SSS family solute:Na+ symporter